MKTVHKICTYLRKRYDSSDICLQCVYEPKVPKPLCMVKAEEIINIVKTGNPWGKKDCKWP